MRYHLNLRKGDDLVEDFEGSEHGDLALAKTEAIDAARQLISQAVLAGWDILDQCFEISDSLGTIITRVPFAQTVRRQVYM